MRAEEIWNMFHRKLNNPWEIHQTLKQNFKRKHKRKTFWLRRYFIFFSHYTLKDVRRKIWKPN